jgi:hypothetical protein
MALTVENGTGVAGADSYVSVTDTDTYWNNRQHDSLYAGWSAADSSVKEGAIRAACQYLDSVFGPYYRGTRKNYTQGLEWPRNGEVDEADEDEDGDTDEYLPVRDVDGVDLPAIPLQLKWAVYEVAARAASNGYIIADNASGQRVRFKKIDVLETQYFDDGSNQSVNVSYGFVSHMMHPILLSGYPQGNPSWNWR